MKWWEMSSAEIAKDPEAQRQRHSAYHTVFMSTGEGRRVLADLRNMVRGVRLEKGCSLADESTRFVGQLSILQTIRERCGVKDELQVIEGENKASAEFVAEPVPKEFDAGKALTEGL